MIYFPDTGGSVRMRTFFYLHIGKRDFHQFLLILSSLFSAGQIFFCVYFIIINLFGSILVKFIRVLLFIFFSPVFCFFSIA